MVEFKELNLESESPDSNLNFAACQLFDFVLTESYFPYLWVGIISTLTTSLGSCENPMR